MLGLGLLGSGIIFLFIASAMVHHWGGHAYDLFKLPIVFWLSTVLITVSSFSLWLAVHNFKLEAYAQYRMWVGVTLALGVLFIACQSIGWVEMRRDGQWLSQSISGSFIYILSGLHAVHILLGLGLLCWLFIDSLGFKNYVEGYIASLNPAKTTRLRLTSIYWHFVGALWVILFCLFLVKHA